MEVISVIIIEVFQDEVACEDQGLKYAIEELRNSNLCLVLDLALVLAQKVAIPVSLYQILISLLNDFLKVKINFFL